MNAIELLDAKAEIIRLKVRGEGVEEIAAKLGLAKGTVQRIIRDEFTARAATRQDLIAEHKLYMDWLRGLVTKRIEENNTAGRWERKELELAVRLMESERKLFGLDSPTKIDVNHLDATSDEELAEECRRFGIPTALPAHTTPPAEPELIPEAEYTTRN